MAIALLGTAGAIFWVRLHGAADELRRRSVVAPNAGGAEAATADAPPEPDRPPLHHLLVREIFRQGLLMAERNGALPARDRVLEGTGTADDADPNKWDVSADLIQHVGIDLRLRRRGDSAAAWKTLIPYKNNWLDHLDLAERTTQFIAQDFPAAMGAAAGAGKGADKPVTAGLDAASLERDLGQINFISAFTAVRTAHADVRARGETPEALGALVRGYANLGQLTLFNWNAAPKALAARSMLYAQRMIDRWPKSPMGLWHRAYAVAFAGHQGRALQDLDAADQLAAATTPATAAPPWVPLIRQFCRYESTRLAEASGQLSARKSPLAPLAQLLLFITIESCNSPSFVNSVGQVILEDNPDCFRVLDRMIEVSGVSFNHQLTVYGPVAMMQSLATRLRRLPDLPPTVREALAAAMNDPADVSRWAALTTALIETDAAPQEELPWRALGQIVRETQFVQVWRRTNFIVNALGASAANEVQQWRPLIREHRYRAFVQLHGHDRPSVTQKRAILKDVRVIDPVQTMGRAFAELHYAGLRPPSDQQDPGANLSYSQWATRYRDNTSFDFERNLRSWQYSERDLQFVMYQARELARESPHAPLYMAMMIDYNWPMAEPAVPEWEANWGDHPLLSGALGKHYAKARDWQKAEQYLTAYLRKAPDLWARRMLARAQLLQGHDADWLATLQAGLQQPDYGLDHARINADIAWHYVDRRQFEQAKPFAYAAASSGSSWGLACAAHVEECLGHWAEAENLIRRDAERYGHTFNWLSWCARTGHGNLAAARRAADAQSRAPRGDLAGREATVLHAAAVLFAGERDAALPPLRDSAQKFNDTWAAMMAIVFDVAQDAAARQAALRQLIAVANDHLPVPGKPRPETEWVWPAIMQLAKVWLESTDPARLDVAKAEQLVRASDTSKERLNLNYFIGRILLLQDRRDEAITYLRRAAADEANNGSIACTLAWIEFRGLGLDPSDVYKEPAAPSAAEEAR